jgi:predicted nicotinamide N-methyase
MYVLHHRRQFAGRSICEVGAGMGVSGLMAACGTDATRVVLTDGDPTVLARLQYNVALVSISAHTAHISYMARQQLPLHNCVIESSFWYVWYYTSGSIILRLGRQSSIRW